MENYLNKLVKKLDGNILAFGNLSDKVINSINENNNILLFDLLNNSKDSGDSSDYKNKKIRYSNIRKKYMKKNITNIIAIYSDLEEYKNNFIIDSIVISKKNIYLMVSKKDDIELIKCQ